MPLLRRLFRLRTNYRTRPRHLSEGSQPESTKPQKFPTVSRQLFCEAACILEDLETCWPRIGKLYLLLLKTSGRQNKYLPSSRRHIWGESGENWFIHRGGLFAGGKFAACNHFNPGRKNWFLPNLSSWPGWPTISR